MITKEMDAYLSDYYRKLLYAVLLRNGGQVEMSAEEWDKILHTKACHVATCDSDGKFTVSIYPLTS